MGNEIAELQGQLAKINYDGSGMEIIHSIKNGLGFFPYSNGLWEATRKFPVGGVMVLGQDFGDTEYVTRLKRQGESEKMPTWRNLLKLLEKSGVDEHNCFFTNAIMGARMKGESMTGKAPPFKRKHRNGDNFLKECFEFLEKQVLKQRPKLIICMGKWTMQFLKMNLKSAPLNDFSVQQTYRKMKCEVINITIGTHMTKAVLIVHPSTPNRTNNRTIKEEAAVIKKAL